ncbi:MAG TPA: phospholipase A2, partial [Egibacteraceae bacterium]|nr:phospholipase A2 [Egibacteraceae bacterium]
AGETWDYPNAHGDILVSANASGAKTGPTRSYDPYGQALAGIPENSAADMDYGWLGSHMRPLEHAAGIATIEMGARPYVPSLGRFLSVDPVEGGSANHYDYVSGDPVNGFDLTGLCNEAATWCVIGILEGTETLPDGFEGWLAARSNGEGRVVVGRTDAGTRAMRSDGSCSFFLGDTGRSYNFGSACRTHDLGYDLMRFFGYTGEQGAIRKAVDRLFLSDMRAHCGGRSFVLRPTCRAWARTYYEGVAANSWFYGYQF